MKNDLDEAINIKREILCALARQNCIMMLETRKAVDREMVARICEFVSTLCLEVEAEDAGCGSQSRTCREAAEALKGGDTARYLELCGHACATCPYSSQRQEEEMLLQ